MSESHDRFGHAVGNATTVLRTASSTVSGSNASAVVSQRDAPGIVLTQHSLHNASSRHGNATHAAEDPENAGVAVLIFYLVLALMIASQTGLLWWKRKHKRSYELVTLLGLWLFPAAISFHLRFWRFLAVWAVYTAVTAYMLSLCINRRRLDKTTPSRVYSWFLGSHRVSVCLGVAGYGLLVAEMFGLGPVMKLLMPEGTSLVILWYGLYYGVLGRDMAEVASDRMAAVMGSGRQLSVSLQNCGICASELDDYRSHMGGGGSNGSGAASAAQPSIQLPCKHLFHPLCIKGWTLVGKKSTCPVCMEKMDLRHLYAERPWETRNLTWVQMLDAVRYIVVWNPVLLLGVHFILTELGVAPHPQDHSRLVSATAQNSSILGVAFNASTNASISHL